MRADDAIIRGGGQRAKNQHWHRQWHRMAINALLRRTFGQRRANDAKQGQGHGADQKRYHQCG